MMFGLFKLTGGKDVTSIDLIEIGDKGYCQAVRVRIINGGTARNSLQVRRIEADGPAWVATDYEIQVVGVGSLAYCNGLAERELGQKCRGVIEPKSPDQIDLRILTRLIEVGDEFPMPHPADYYMGRLSLGRTVWHGDVAANPYAVKEAIGQ